MKVSQNVYFYLKKRRCTEFLYKIQEACGMYRRLHFITFIFKLLLQCWIQKVARGVVPTRTLKCTPAPGGFEILCFLVFFSFNATFFWNTKISPRRCKHPSRRKMLEISTVLLSLKVKWFLFMSCSDRKIGSKRQFWQTFMKKFLFYRKTKIKKFKYIVF